MFEDPPNRKKLNDIIY